MYIHLELGLILYYTINGILFILKAMIIQL